MKVLCSCVMESDSMFLIGLIYTFEIVNEKATCKYFTV